MTTAPQYVVVWPDPDLAFNLTKALFGPDIANLLESALDDTAMPDGHFIEILIVPHGLILSTFSTCILTKDAAVLPLYFEKSGRKQPEGWDKLTREGKLLVERVRNEIRDEADRHTGVHSIFVQIDRAYVVLLDEEISDESQERVDALLRFGALDAEVEWHLTDVAEIPQLHEGVIWSDPATMDLPTTFDTGHRVPDLIAHALSVSNDLPRGPLVILQSS